MNSKFVVLSGLMVVNYSRERIVLLINGITKLGFFDNVFEESCVCIFANGYIVEFGILNFLFNIFLLIG